MVNRAARRRFPAAAPHLRPATICSPLAPLVFGAGLCFACRALWEIAVIFRQRISAGKQLSGSSDCRTRPDPWSSRAGASWGLFCARCRARLSEAGGARGEIFMLKILFACARSGQFVPTGLRRSLSLTQARVRGEAERRGKSAPRFGPRRRRVIFCFCSARWRRWPRRSELRGQLRQAGDRNSTTWGALLVFSHPRARARRSRAARRNRRRALGRGGAELFFVFALLAGGGGRGALSYGVSFAKRAIATARHGLRRCSFSLTRARVRGEAERRGESAPRFGPRRRRVIFAVFCSCSLAAVAAAL